MGGETKKEVEISGYERRLKAKICKMKKGNYCRLQEHRGYEREEWGGEE